MHVVRVEVRGGTLRLLAGGKVAATRQLGAGEIDRLVEEVSDAYGRPTPDLRAIGRRLYDWLDQAGDRELSRRLTDAHGLGMTLVVDTDESLRNLPWELTAARGGFLADNGGPLFSPARLMGRPMPGPKQANRPLRLLFMAAAPGAPEHAHEMAALRTVTESTDVELVVEQHGGLAGLQERFGQFAPGWFDVFHLTGQTDVDATPEQLAEAVGGNWPRLVFVSGYRTGEPPSFAERLVELGAPCVLSWSRHVDERYASLVAIKLYERLSDGDSVEGSVAKARAVLLRQEARRGTADYWHLLRTHTRVGAIGSLVTLRRAKGRAKPELRQTARPARFGRGKTSPTTDTTGPAGPAATPPGSAATPAPGNGPGGSRGGTGPDAGTGGAGPRARAEPRTQARAGTRAGTDTIARTGTGTGARGGTSEDAGAQARAAIRADAAARAKVRANARTDARAKLRASAGTDAAPRAKLRASADAKAGARAKASRGTDADARAKPRANARTDAGPKAKGSPGSDADAGAEVGGGARIDAGARARAIVEASAIVPTVVGIGINAGPGAGERRTGETVLNDFVGRRRELEWALEQLAGAGPGPDVLVIHGMGGLGKSRLALRLCDRLQPHRCLVHSGRLGEPTLHQVVAGELGPEAAALLAGGGRSPVQRLRRLLQAAPAPLVFVFDDVDPNLESAGRLPLLDARGRAGLRPAALHVVGSLVEAIRAEASPARVVITCRHPLALDQATRRLGHLGLQGLQGEGLAELVRRLPQIGGRAADDPVRTRALELAGGNPTLLQRIDDTLADGEPGAREIAERMEAVAEGFRASIGAGALFGALRPSTRTALATLTVCRLPVDRKAALRVSGCSAADLDQAAGASLVEVGFDPGGTRTTYRVAPVVAEIAAAALSADLLVATSARAFAHLHKAWTKKGVPLSDERAVELVRLGLAADRPRAVTRLATDLLSRWLESPPQMSRAIDLAERVLAAVDDPLVRTGLARARLLLGDAATATATDSGADASPRAAQTVDQPEPAVAPDEAPRTPTDRMARIVGSSDDPDQTLDLLRQALESAIASDDAMGKAVAILGMGRIAAQQDDIPRALDLLQRSADLFESADEPSGTADALFELGKVAAQQGDGLRALDLYQRTLALKETVGEPRDKAVVLSNMGQLASEAGDARQASMLFTQSLDAAIAIGAWSDAAIYLGNLAAVSNDRALLYAQAAWLCARVEVAVHPALTTWVHLAEQLLPGHDLLATMALLARSVAVSGDRDLHVADQIMTRALGDIDLDDQAAVNQAFFRALDRAGDPATLYDRFLAGCAALVPRAAWRFDPARVPPRSDADRLAIGKAIKAVIFDM